MNVGTLTAKFELMTGAFEKSPDDAGKKAWEAGKKLPTAVTAPVAAAGAVTFKFVQAQGPGRGALYRRIDGDGSAGC